MAAADTTGPTVAATLADAVARLAAAGVPEPRADAEVLLAFALGTSRAGLVVRAREPLPDAAAEPLAALLAARAGRRVPVAHLVGRREFWSMDLAVDGRVLVPRPESELLVETVLRVAPGARRVLDCGTGSGCLAAALARGLPRAVVVASDRSADALAVARGNLARLAPGAGLVRGDLLRPFRAGAFDVIVTNPPYVPTADVAALDPEVRDHEPRAALDGGPDGLDAFRTLLAEAPDALLPRGWLVAEMGAGQAGAIRAIAERDGRWAQVEIAPDHAGIPRVLAARTAGGETGCRR